ncbi:MAG: serine/threonine protein kinase [Pseudomonadota bacterium]
MADAAANQAYQQLSPDQVLIALEELGFECDGRLLALNSYENRVYRVGIEDESAAAANSVVAKFYRPQRWSDDQIIEEHKFTELLASLEIPVVAPQVCDGRTLHHVNGFRVAIFPNKGGRAPDLEDFDQLTQFGRFIGRIHRASQAEPFSHRPALNIDSFGHAARQTVIESDLLPSDLRSAYESLTAQLLDEIGHNYERAGDVTLIRCHGDCHP